MSGTYKSFKTDQNLEVNGIYLDLGGAGKFKLCRAGGSNRSFQELFYKLTKPYRRAIQTETLPEEVSNSILVKVYSRTVIIGWENVTSEDGSPLPFSIEACEKILTDLPDLFSEIRRAAEDAANFRKLELSEDSGN